MAIRPLSELLKLSPAERIQLAQDLWDSLTEDEAPALTPEQLEELERRLAAHDENPAAAVPHDQVRARLQARFGA
jgi:putative addiction module component (TIGR02574 family)